MASCNVHLRDRPSVWSLLKRDSSLFRISGVSDRAVRVRLLDGSAELRALITPPEAVAAVAVFGAVTAAQHTLPRLDLFTRFERPEIHTQRRRGLTPRALRLVRDHIDANIEHYVDLKSMADAAGLSLHHFARAFKDSEGITPHAFVLSRRIARANALLVTSKLSLAEVAAASGFSDQSHFTRCFRRATGLAPGVFRKSMQ
jgi:transcriptional regulator GlxA family with amidase domain